VGLSLLLASLSGLAVNFRSCDLHRERTAERYGHDLLASVAPRGLLIIYGDTAVHSVWYRQAILGQAPGVLILSQGHFSPWYFEQLRRRYPEENWPPYNPEAPPTQHLALLLQRLSPGRPIFFSSDPGTGGVVRAGPAWWWSVRAAVPTGMLVEIRSQEQPLESRDRVEWNARFWQAALSHLPPPRKEAGLETQTIELEYALAALRCADFAARQGMKEEAGELYKVAFRFDCDRCERDLQAAYAAIGRSIPLPGLRGRAEAGIERLEGTN